MKKKILGFTLGAFFIFGLAFTTGLLKPNEARAEQGQICRCHRLQDQCMTGAAISFRPRCAATCSTPHPCAVTPDQSN